MGERVIVGFPDPQPVDVGGSKTFRVPLCISGRLRRVFAQLLAGTAANFTITIYDKETTPADANIVLQFDTAGTTDPTLLDLNADLLFRNQDRANCLWVVLTPNAGADNDFTIRLDAAEGLEYPTA